VPWDTARRLALSPVLHTRKRHALAAYLHPEHAELAAAHEVYLA
jgi:hypothetical protein